MRCAKCKCSIKYYAYTVDNKKYCSAMCVERYLQECEVLADTLEDDADYRETRQLIDNARKKLRYDQN